MSDTRLCFRCRAPMVWREDLPTDGAPDDWTDVTLWQCTACDTFFFIGKQPRRDPLDEWIAQYPRLHKSSRALWKAIKQEFDEQQPPMTVRQMFYRMSAIGVVPKDETRGYRVVARALASMRRAGAIPYGWLADNTRWVRKPTTYRGMDSALAEMQRYYRRALWQSQPHYIEIWLEKDALAGVFFDITEEFDVPLYVTRGYASMTYLYEAAESLKAIERPIFIYHFGDYDASGQDAARSIRDGLREHGAQFEFRQYAVTPQQIGELNLQTRPAKRSDSRASRHGELACELDAIEPATLRQMVRQVIESHIDQDALAFELDQQRRERDLIGDWRANFGTSTKT